MLMGAELIERRGATVVVTGSGDIVAVFVSGVRFLAGEALLLAGDAPALAGVLAGDALPVFLAGDALPLPVAFVVAFVARVVVAGFAVALAVDDFIRNANLTEPTEPETNPRKRERATRYLLSRVSRSSHPNNNAVICFRFFVRLHPA